MTTPRDLQFSNALKPVSIPSSAITRSFLPITSGVYTPSSNNIIRIPFNANSFIDLKNMMLRYSLKNTGTTPVALDGSSASFISRLNILSPDGSPLETIDNYNRLYQAMAQLECSRDNYQGIRNMLEGTSRGQQRIEILGSAANTLSIFVDDVQVGTLTLNAADRVDVGDYTFVAATTTLEVFYRNQTGGTLTYATSGTTSSVPGLTFVSGGTNSATLICNGATIGNGANLVEVITGDYSGNLQSEVLVASGSRFYSHNLLSTITKLDVLFPAMVVGGGGVVIEITLAPTNEVFQTTDTLNVAPSYEINSVELIAPVINYADQVNQSFRQMLQSQGSVSMSSMSYQAIPFPITANATTLSIPVSVRARSLKAIYFFFAPNSSASNFSYARCGARESPLTLNYQLRIGGQYYPASVVPYNATATNTNITQAVIELEKSVSKLSDIRHGSLFNASNFVLPQVSGGLAMYGLDLESSPTSFLESGVNTADNSLNMFLELSNMSWTTQTGLITPTLQGTAGTVFIFALFDNSLSVMSNGSLLMTK